MQKILRHAYIVLFTIKGSNPEIVKNIARWKVYISGMEMSQRIHFWYQIWPKMLIFWENGKKKKKKILVKKFCDKLKKLILI